MALRPILQTSRLQLRPFVPEDAPLVQQLASDREVALPTLGIPHPYPEGAAARWIDAQAAEFDSGRGLTLAIVLKEGHELVGSISLIGLSATHQRAELGYWMAKHRWSMGYCTEAAQGLVGYAFSSLKLHRIEANCLRRNVRSARVLQKLGATPEGCLRERVCQSGRYEDLVMFGLLASEWRGPPVALQPVSTPLPTDKARRPGKGMSLTPARSVPAGSSSDPAPARPPRSPVPPGR